VYVYNSGDGNDIIVDNPTDGVASGDGGDGKGAIVYDSQMLQGGLHRTGAPGNTYTSLDGTFTYVWDGVAGHDLTINGALTVKAFTNGQLGLVLTNEPSFDTGLPDRTVFTKVVANPTPPPDTITVPVFDEDGNGYVVDTATNDLIHALGGNDVVGSGVGNDQLYGDEGNDLLQGGEGADTVFGGAGNDALTGGLGDDQLFGDDTNDPVGVVGNDTLDGGLEDEQLLCAA
jgi:Ca2+-binding RTX toxin-like protein